MQENEPVISGYYMTKIKKKIVLETMAVKELQKGKNIKSRSKKMI